MYRYKEGMNSEKVDAQGVTNIVQESGNHIQRPVSPRDSTCVEFFSSANVTTPDPS